MNVEAYREYCLAKAGTTEAMPFDDNTLVFKVGNKMFALAGLKNFEFINLKCDPGKAVELRAEHPAIRPGYHMNKQHWNSVYHAELMDDNLLRELIDQSYELILTSLTKKLQAEIKSQE